MTCAGVRFGVKSALSKTKCPRVACRLTFFPNASGNDSALFRHVSGGALGSYGVRVIFAGRKSSSATSSLYVATGLRARDDVRRGSCSAVVAAFRFFAEGCRSWLFFFHLHLAYTLVNRLLQLVISFLDGFQIILILVLEELLEPVVRIL